MNLGEVWVNTEPSPWESVDLPQEIEILAGPNGQDKLYKIKVLKPEDYKGVYAKSNLMAKIVLEKFFKRK